ncbi:MAG TPA: patatin-like phospholipase family protein [Nitrososphaeraceae archaeon]|nr:patatin-like phospholipase family protein [Nitrososphaeraceae archaeon]
MSYKIKEASPPRHKRTRSLENVLVMQGGGSLGSFACGVFKALVKKNIQIDIVAGTSIGAVNAAIIAGSKSDQPEKDLEDFWMEVSESNMKIIPDLWTFEWDSYNKEYLVKKISSASINAAIFGVPKMFVPRWQMGNSSSLIRKMNEGTYFDLQNWTYIYDHSPLEKTLEKYIDYKKLNLAATQEERPNVLRLIMTAVNVMTGKPLVFDNTMTEIKAKHILACSGYPIYGFPWVEIEDNVYGWDGSLLSNTPIREVLFVSPRNDKNIFIVENYSQNIDRLPTNMTEVINRYKDILFCDKDMYNIQLSKLITRHINLIEKLYDKFEKYTDKTKIEVEELKKIKEEYTNLIENYGAEIKSVTRITRSETESPTMLKNADFSTKTIKNLIEQGERKTLDKLASNEPLKFDFNL